MNIRIFIRNEPLVTTATTTKDIDKYLSKNRLAFQVRSHDEIQIIFHSNSKYIKKKC